MKKITFIMVMFLLLPTCLVFGIKVAAMPELVNPNTIVLDDKQIYITEGMTVFIYSAKDYKFVKKFGNKGEGPREFLGNLEIIPQKNYLLINSQGKISYFTKNGAYIKEKKTGTRWMLCPLENGFVAKGTAIESSIAYITICFYDSNLNKIKELYRKESIGQTPGKIKLFPGGLLHRTNENRIFATKNEAMSIDVLDKTGKILYTISHDYEKCKVTSDDEQNVRDALRLQNKGFYELNKNNIEFLPYFPPIRDLHISDNKLFALTYKTEGDKSEFYIFDIKGKFLKKLMLPVSFMTFFDPYPYVIKNKKIYQVIENEKEEWELYIHDIAI